MAKIRPVLLNKVFINLLVWQLIAPTAVIGLLLLSVYGYQNFLALKQNQQQTVNAIAGRLDDYIKNSRQAMSGLADLAQSQSAELPLYMQAVYQSNPIFSTIYYLDPQGRVINLIPFDPGFVNLDMSAQPFMDAVENPNTSYLARPATSPRTGEFSVSLAIQMNDRHFLVAEIALDKIQALVISNNDSLAFPAGETFISDIYGNLLAHPNPSFVEQQVNTTELVKPLRFYNIPGISEGTNGISLTASQTASEVRWSVTTQLPIRLAIRPYIISGTVLIIILLALWGGVVSRIRNSFFEEISGPLSSLRNSVKLLSKGDFSTPTYPVNVPVKIMEIKELSEDFQRMSRAIQVRQAALLESEQQERDHRVLAEALRDTAGTLTSTLNFSEVLERILSNVGKVVPHDFSYITLLDDDGEHVHVLAQKGFQPDNNSEFPWHGSQLTLSNTPTLKKMYETGNPLIIPDTLLEPGWAVVGESAWIQSYAGAPIKVKNKIIGFINLNSKTPGFYDQATVERLQAFADQAGMALDNAKLLQDLQEAYEKTLFGWSKALELRDNETEGHTNRVVELTERLARRLGVTEPELTYIRYGSLLHDIGKIGIPDSILLKEGPLTEEEWETMKQHPVYAYKILSPIPYLGSSVDIPYSHHEKWDGSGYPQGLRGEQIPLSARIFSILDVWDGLISRRPYHEPWTEEAALQHIRMNSGQQFDPAVVEEFVKFYEEELKHQGISPRRINEADKNKPQ